MEYEEFSPLDNTLINNNEKLTNIGKKPIIEKFIDEFPINNDKGLTINVEKIMVLINGEWSFDTYIKSNNSISKKMVKKYILKLKKDYEIEDISYEFHGGPPMGTKMVDYNEITGDNIWVVNLKPALYSYLKKKGNIGNFEDLYTQIGGSNDNFLTNIWNNLKFEFKYINYIIVDTINKFFFIKENKEKKLDPQLFKPVNQIITHYDGVAYYTYLNVYKDGKYIDKMQIRSKNNPIEWKYIMNKIFEINKDSKFYGYIYKLSHSIDKGIILETTDDQRYKINYNLIDQKF